MSYRIQLIKGTRNRRDLGFAGQMMLLFFAQTKKGGRAKRRGQTLRKVGAGLEEQVFVHNSLLLHQELVALLFFVAASRVGSPSLLCCCIKSW